MHKGEHLGDVNVGERVHDGVKEVVDEDHGHDGVCRAGITRLVVSRTDARPYREYGRHAGKSEEILDSSAEDGNKVVLKGVSQTLKPKRF